MPVRIEVITTVPDSRAEIRKKKFLDGGFAKVKHVIIIDVYTIDKSFSPSQLQKIGEALTNPVTQEFEVRLNNKPSSQPSREKEIKEKFTWAVEIGFLPGVTDNVAHTTKEIIEDLLKVKFINGENVYTSQLTYIEGQVSRSDVEKIASTLFNPIIQRVHIKSFQEFLRDGGMDMIIPKVTLSGNAKVTQVNLSVIDDELQQIGKLGIQNSDGTRRGPLALDLTFMKAIQKYFAKKKRKPTDIELESLAQTWSEHCKHTIFANPIDEVKNGLFNTYIRRATEKIRKKNGKRDYCVSVFTDNSGAIEFDNEYLITHKVETHNSPSALDPFGGAITGIVGVNRDAIGFGLGAKPVANFYGFCFADPNKDVLLFKGKNFTQPMLSSRRIMDGVIDGVNAGGNQSGIPTPQGFVYFDERYRGKPLVFVGTVGLIPKKIKGHKSWLKKANKGDYIVMVGGRVGKDGIHGATFSSEAMDSGSPATAVQIGDPITQKKLSDALVKEARDQLLYTSITDNGAGGLSCSVAEMAKESGGCVVDLEKVPLKYPGLTPWEIWISESQERMTLSVSKTKWKKLSTLLKKRGVEATIIGTFTNSGKCIVKYKGKTIMDIDMHFLHDGMPPRPMTTKAVTIKNEELRIKEPKDQAKTLLHMLSRLNIGSYAFISSQYDHIVQAGLVLPPLQGRGRVNSETSAFRPILSSPKAVMLSQSMYPTLTEIDPYAMTIASIDTAVRNMVVAGADPKKIALLDNFCWCSSNDPERLYQLKMAAKACFDGSVFYNAPFISGKDSMFNDFNGYDKKGNPIKISILPTLLISTIAVVDDSTKVVSLDTKMPGDLIYVLGDTSENLAGSEFAQMQNMQAKFVPYVTNKKSKKLYEDLHHAIQDRLVASAIAVGRGGLGVALSKMSIGGMLGISATLQKVSGKVKSNIAALYSENPGRIVVTVAPENKKKFETILKGNSFVQIGEVTNDNVFHVRGLNGKAIITSSVHDLQNAYTKTFRGW